MTMMLMEHPLIYQALPWYDGSMTKKIGISLSDDLYEWAAREVAAGRADSVSALLAHGLEVLRSRSELAAIVRDLEAEIGEVDEETKARGEEALRAAEEARRRWLAKRMGATS
jgi:Arc/MetJ-type ribon-helix-helix transcriptional regulator